MNDDRFLTHSKDNWYWITNKEKTFTVANVKRWLDSGVARDNWYKMEWCKWVPNKCNIFWWRVEMDRIPTKSALMRRNIQVGSEICVFCEDMEEITEHLFTVCALTSGVWQGIAEWCNVPSIFAFDIHDLIELYKRIPGSDLKRKVFQGIVIITCWRIWKARNEKVFSNTSTTVVSIVMDVKALGFLWFRIRSNDVLVDWKK
ncbi:uncharacterized protein LOC118492187 [Helianthus annuus]|uniref:uncharacterized protein LOC118492187 n=1 Tax=Helianthus annuus TaxID=4232 RepID=UPI001652C78D|nr:uncharacterized protein LOC118492187 [Helianthus annuus]